MSHIYIRAIAYIFSAGIDISRQEGKIVYRWTFADATVTMSLASLALCMCRVLDDPKLYNYNLCIAHQPRGILSACTDWQQLISRRDRHVTACHWSSERRAPAPVGVASSADEVWRRAGYAATRAAELPARPRLRAPACHCRIYRVADVLVTSDWAAARWNIYSTAIKA